MVNSGEAELLGVHFDKVGLLAQSVGGLNPRKMHVILPPLDSVAFTPQPHLSVKASGKKRTKSSLKLMLQPRQIENLSLVEMLKRKDYGCFFVLESKEPVFEGHSYFLDFGGRVTVSSVKNFQVHRPYFMSSGAVLKTVNC